MDFMALLKQCHRVGAHCGSTNGYLRAETKNLNVVFTPEGGVLVVLTAESVTLTEQDYGLLQVILDRKASAA
jgi:hypothetical protein